MLIDTHCHLNFNTFKDNHQYLSKQALDDNIWMIIVGTHSQNSKRALDMTLMHDNGVFASIGLHPVHILKQVIQEGDKRFKTKGEKFQKDYYRTLIKAGLRTYPHELGFKSFLPKQRHCRRITAIGETGLDYYYFKNFSFEDQKKIQKMQISVFSEHVDLAMEFGLPVIIHARGTQANPYGVYDDLITVLEYERLKWHSRIEGVVHAFQGTKQQAKRLTEMGLHIGLGGHIMHDADLQHATREIDLNSIVLETDAPYFHPSGNGADINHPGLLPQIAHKLAELKQTNIYTIEKETTQNALDLFRLHH